MTVSYERAAKLEIELERAAVRELLRTFHLINYGHFRDALRAPAIEIVDATSELGAWSRDNRTIRLAKALVFGQPWSVVVEVLKHEMAHQYAHEVLGAWDEVAHGKAFRDVCARLGIDAKAAGMPEAKSARSEEEERILERIHRLLALASSANEHEAQSAMNAAQKLMLKHNLGARGTPREYVHAELGRPSGRIQESERLLANVLAEHFFVETIWVPAYRPLEQKRGSVLEICGTASNVEMATYVHGFLTETSERLWREHKRKTNVTSNRDRQKFVAGVILGFQEKLRASSRANEKEGLVWVKDGNLDEYFRKRHPRVRNVTYRGGAPSEAYAHGREAGRGIVLHRPVGAAATSSGRFLPPKR